MDSEESFYRRRRCCTSGNPHNLAGLHNMEQAQNGRLIECETTSSTFYQHWTSRFRFCPGCGMYLDIAEGRKLDTAFLLDYGATYKCGKCSLYLGPGAGSPDARCPDCKGEWVKIE